MAKLINGITPDVRRAILRNAATIASAVSEAVLELTGVNGTKTFYASSTSGGTCTVLNTVTIEDGRITAWTQTTPSGTPGQWLFNDADQSGQYLTVGF